MDQVVQDLSARQKILADNQGYFSHSAIIFVNKDDKDNLMERLNAFEPASSKIVADAKEVWAIGAQIDHTRLIHVFVADNQCRAVIGNRFMAELSDGLYSEVCNFMGPTAVMMYRQVYTYEPSVHPVNSFRTVRDRTEDLKLGVLVDAISSHHGLPEIVRLRSKLANHGA
jgi:hypothetical protein